MSDPVDEWAHDENAATASRRAAILEKISAGMLTMSTTIGFIEGLCRRLDALEKQAPAPMKIRQPCGCASCQGFNGWFAACQGITP